MVMRLSLNEIEGGFTKAALGVGLPQGLAEDAGTAVAWLAARGLPGVDEGAAALAAFESRAVMTPEWREEPEGPVLSGCPSALLAAPILSDAACCLDGGAGGSRIGCDSLDHPLLAVALLALAARNGAPPLLLREGDRRWHLSAKGARLDGVLEPAPGPLSLEIAREVIGGDLEPARQAQLDHGCAVEEESWACVKRYAARRLVPESDASRGRGAGAGAIDND